MSDDTREADEAPRSSPTADRPPIPLELTAVVRSVGLASVVVDLDLQRAAGDIADDGQAGRAVVGRDEADSVPHRVELAGTRS